MTAGSDLTQPTVLVVDDDPLMRIYVMALLRQIGCRGVVVDDGAKALKALATRRFDLVLMDVCMPVLDGLATLAWVRRQDLRHHDGRRQRVVMVTGHAVEGDLARLQAAGADGCIGKPIVLSDFRTEIQRCLAL